MKEKITCSCKLHKKLFLQAVIVIQISQALLFCTKFNLTNTQHSDKS